MSRSAIRRLPLFMAYCPDAPNALAKRLEVRPEHLKRWSQDRESGRGCESTPCYLASLCLIMIWSWFVSGYDYMVADKKSLV